MVLSFRCYGFQPFEHRRMKASLDQVHGFRRRVGYASKTNFILSEDALRHPNAAPGLQPFPESRPHQDKWKRSDFLALNQSGRFEELVERPQSTRHYNESAGVFYQAHLPSEKVAELD